MIFFFFLLAASLSTFQAENDFTRLLKHVREASPDPTINPFSAERNITLEVNVSVTLIALMDVNEVQLNTLWYIMSTYSFNHPHIRWNPEDFGNRASITVDDGIWHPVLMACASLDDKLQMAPLQKYKINHDGIVSSNLITQTLTPCGMDFKNMPYDVHRCMFCIGFATDGDFPRILHVKMSPDMFVMNNTNWGVSTVISIASDVELIGPSVVDEAIIYIHIARNSQFYTIMVVIPIIFVSAYVIFNQVTYEDKGGSFYGGVGFLGFVFGYVATELPKQNKIPALGWFVFAVVANLSVHGYVQMTLREFKRLTKARRKKKNAKGNGNVSPESGKVQPLWRRNARKWLTFTNAPWLVGAISGLILAATYPLIFSHPDLLSEAIKLKTAIDETIQQTAAAANAGQSKELPTDITL